jgi:hypothetical protein
MQSIQKQFAEKAKSILACDTGVTGLAVGGTWLTGEIDEFSDLDLIIVTREKISGERNKMLAYAEKLGKLLAGFTGEHVGEPRVLICLYDEPLLHVDLKFVTIEEFKTRIETPEILLDRDDQLQQAIQNSEAKYPYPDYQWIEDRFWIWIHYGLVKIGRGEYFEAIDFLAYLRMVVLGPLLHIRHGRLPKGVRKIETVVDAENLSKLKQTLASTDRQSLVKAVENSVALYRSLRAELFPNISLKSSAEHRVMEYLNEVKAG